MRGPHSEPRCKEWGKKTKKNANTTPTAVHAHALTVSFTVPRLLSASAAASREWRGAERAQRKKKGWPDAHTTLKTETQNGEGSNRYR